MKEEPNYDSNITTARLNEKVIILLKESLQPISSQKSWVTSQKILFLPLAEKERGSGIETGWRGICVKRITETRANSHKT